jgi:hypothetical protein
MKVLIPARGRCAVAAGALLVGLLASVPSAAAETDVAALRQAMEQAFAAAEKDHARVRARDFGDKLGDFPARLAGPLCEARKQRERPVPAKVDALLAALRGSGALPLSATSLRVIFTRLLPKDAVVRAEISETECRDAFVAEARDVFAAERFEDCWDAMFGALPEVAAWRAAHAPKTPETTAAPAPEAGGTPPGPEKAPPAPEPEPPAPPKAPELPSPSAADGAVNLLLLDRARPWVGPWTGWTQEIPERDNRRQKRPAKSVWMDRYEVTCAAYLRFLEAQPPLRRADLLPVGWTSDERGQPAHPPGKERHPVTGVTLAQAQAYAEWAGKRLPTEDEWDRAAGGGEKDPRAFPWGPATEGLRWAFAGQGADGPVPVDAFPDDRTPDGIVGLAGNVAELVATLPDRRELPAKLQPAQDVVVRGGSWRTDRESNCGSSFRWVLPAGQGAPHVGFRCVMDEAEYRKQFR